KGETAMGISTTGAPIRNLALVGHAGAGKTTLAEGIAFAAGATNRRGTIQESNTLSDYHPDEIARKHSINTSLISFSSQGTKLNIIDAPGYTDFTGEVRAALHVADTALITVDAQHGVEAGTAQVWEFSQHDQNSVIFIANKLEHVEANFDETGESLKNRLAHRKLFPVLCAAAEKNIGPSRILDFIVANAPAPADHIADVRGINPENKKEVSLNTAPKDATTLFVFKTVSEPHLGDLSFFRV